MKRNAVSCLPEDGLLYAKRFAFTRLETGFIMEQKAGFGTKRGVDVYRRRHDWRSVSLPLDRKGRNAQKRGTRVFAVSYSLILFGLPDGEA